MRAAGYGNNDIFFKNRADTNEWTDIVKILLENGADINERNNGG